MSGDDFLDFDADGGNGMTQPGLAPWMQREAFRKCLKRLGEEAEIDFAKVAPAPDWGSSSGIKVRADLSSGL